MAIIELGRMGVKPGHEVMNENTPEGKVLPKVYTAVITVPGGPQRSYWGVETQDASKLWAFFEWNSVNEHQRFAETYGADLVKDLPSVLTHGEFTKHVDVTPAPTLALLAPVTEILLAYFPPEISLEQRTSISKRFQQVVEGSPSQHGEMKGVSYGWGIENDFPLLGTSGEKTGSLFTALIGWSEVGAHASQSELKRFEQNLDSFRDVEGISNLACFHVSCQSSKRVSVG